MSWKKRSQAVNALGLRYSILFLHCKSVLAAILHELCEVCTKLCKISHLQHFCSGEKGGCWIGNVLPGCRIKGVLCSRLKYGQIWRHFYFIAMGSHATSLVSNAPIGWRKTGQATSHIIMLLLAGGKQVTQPLLIPMILLAGGKQTCRTSVVAGPIKNTARPEDLFI